MDMIYNAICNVLIIICFENPIHNSERCNNHLCLSYCSYRPKKIYFILLPPKLESLGPSH